MEKKKITIAKDQKCPICNDRLIDDDGKLIRAINFHSDLIPVSHDECFAPYIAEQELKILVKVRCYSMGDTIAATPIIRELRRIYPRSKIAVMTFYPDIFINSPHIEEIFDLNHVVYEADLASYLFHVDAFTSEKGGHYAMHSVDFSAISSFSRSLAQSDWEYEVNFTDENIQNVRKVLNEFGIDELNDKCIIINPHGTEWETRDWGKYGAQDLVDRIINRYPDHKILSVGGRRSEVPTQEMKNYVKLNNAIDLYGKFSLLDSIALFNLQCSKLLITPDTGTLHLGACSPIPIIGIFTLIRAEFRTPVRFGKYGWKFTGINSLKNCCCTYDARVLTDSMQFNKCPKIKFLKRTLDVDIDKKIKFNGMQNYNPKINWTVEGINNEIREELNRYKVLPCFPKVAEVLAEVPQYLDQQG